ncbi:MAG TPA: hypothetical protein VIP11_17000, partial [Gemmatimonadaceae bacterium]
EVSPLAIVATGTIVRGRPHAASDLDVYVVHDAPFRRRVQRLFNGVPAEIFINPPQTIRAYFRDEQAAGEPLTAHMLATGFVVWSTGTIADQLRAEAREWLDRRSEPSEEETVRARYAAATRLEDAIDVAGTDESTSSMLLTMAVITMLELECRAKAGRIPRRKDLLGIVEAIDGPIGALGREFFSATTYAARRAAAEQIADRTVGARGFFEWDSGPEAVSPQ